MMLKTADTRHAELARALVSSRLEGKYENVHYFAMFRSSQRDALAALEEMVYNYWDNSALAPAKQRPREASATPTLSMILWQAGRPKFPPAIENKFTVGSSHYNEIMKLKQMLEDMWPADPTPPLASNVTIRAAGSPDLSDADLLDLEREVDLLKIAADDFKEERLLDENFGLYIF